MCAHETFFMFEVAVSEEMGAGASAVPSTGATDEAVLGCSGGGG